MHKPWIIVAMLCVVFGLALNAGAATIFTANLTGSQEVPPSGSPGTGSETAILNDAMTQLTVMLTFSGLETNDTMAHIHCCAPPGVNAAVVLPFTGFPIGVTSGTYDHTFTLATDLTGITPDAFLAALMAGTTYSNIHTAQFPGGEIRGQLTAIPEPATFGLTFLAIFGAATLRLKRKRIV